MITIIHDPGGAPVYGFVWLSNCWLDKHDEKQINQAPEGIRDQESRKGNQQCSLACRH